MRQLLLICVSNFEAQREAGSVPLDLKQGVVPPFFGSGRYVGYFADGLNRQRKSTRIDGVVFPAGAFEESGCASLRCAVAFGPSLPKLVALRGFENAG